MRGMGLISLLLLTLAATGCGEVEPGSFQAFDVGEDGAATTDSRGNGIWIGNLATEDAAIGASAIAVTWEGELFIVSTGANLAYAADLDLTRPTTQFGDTTTDTTTDQTLFQQDLTTPAPTLPPPPTFVPENEPFRDPTFTTDSDFGTTDDTSQVDPTAENRTLELSGEIRSYIVNGERMDTGRITGSLITGLRMEADITQTVRDRTLDLSFSSLFRREVLISNLVGSWSRTQGNRTLTLTVDSSGVVNGSRSDGCVLSGTLELLRRGNNLFRLDLTIENCPGENGDYAGFAFLDPESRGAVSGLEQLRVLAEGAQEERFFAPVLTQQ